MMRTLGLGMQVRCFRSGRYLRQKHRDPSHNQHIPLPLYRKEKYPQPVDLIGVTRIYEPAVDKPVRTASMSLMRGIPRDFKGGLRNLEKTVGFKGFKLSELTPNITRRGQV